MTKTRDEIQDIIWPIIQQEILSTHTEANDAAQAVISALITAGVISQWRPIEEAPRDGTRILVGGGTVYWRELMGWFSDSAQRPLQWNPTHFQLLPTPPQNIGE